ncbi:MAG: DMT family transporter [Proteobacteria bacterium]|nr:DMT family transporter [Pseudomonadota bacterium]
MAVVYALISALCWTAASQLYACVTRTLNVRRVNFIKAVISLMLFGLLSWFCFPSQVLNNKTILLLSVSGIFGFALGDLFLFYAFSKIGPARTLMLNGFGPAIIAAVSFLLFNESFPQKKIIGLFLMIACLALLSREKKCSTEANKKILLIGLAGIFLDAIGVALTKHAFTVTQSLNPSQANYHRILAALPVLAFAYWQHDAAPRGKVTKREILILGSAIFLGTFLALFCYLKALSLENAAIVASITLSAPVFSSIYEHIRDRRWPNQHFVGALGLMLCAVWILV